ncbi:MAG: TonB-dependent receptor [Novosphingobium sp.]|nr:TonB-dependent receptor [Novosphingobium sp.]
MNRDRARAARLTLKSMLLTGVAAVIAGTPAVAFAQDAAPADANSPHSEIIVTGYVESLQEARNLKKEAVIQKDVIVAEDIAKFPELNLAESLQRLPGVQITREAGEGRRISLRGLGSDFARVQLNGMEVLGNVDSAQDSRGQRTRDRAFDFNIFASELFSKIEVEKTFQPSQNEGGMAGTVGLFTGKPFDYGEGLTGAITAKLGTNQYTKDAQPRIAAVLSQNWGDTFGIAVSVAYGRRHTTEQGHNTYNYSEMSAEDAQDLVDAGLDISHLTSAQQERFMAGGLYFADGNRISSWDAKQERLGITAAIQWKPTDNFLLTLDGLHGQFTTHRDELHLATRPMSGLGSTTLSVAPGGVWPSQFQVGTVLNDFRVDDNGYVTMTDADNVTFGSEHRRELNKNQFNQAVATMKWEASDRLSFDGHFGYEKSTYKTPYDDKFYMRAEGSLLADYGQDGRSASFSYDWDPTDPANYAMDDFYYRAFNNESELWEGTANLHYKLSDALTFNAGGAYHRFSQGGEDLFYDGGVNGTNGEMRGDPVGDITDVFTNHFGSWLIGDYDAAFAKYDEYHRLEPKPDGTGGTIQDIENVYHTTEETFSGYAQFDWDTELGGMRFRGNVGARFYHTKTNSTGWIQGDSYAYLGTSDVEGSYSGVLPALNTVLELTPETLVRFAATQNINRPGLSSIAAEGTAFKDEDTGEITVSRGNPNLRPYKDTTLDFSIEHYFGKVGLLSASVFHKWIKNFITSNTLHDIPFSETGVPYTTIPGATADTIVTDFDMPTNDPATHGLTGVELAAQAQFTFLPAPFDKLGATANFTYVDPGQITGISKRSYNLTVYYETATFGIRGSMSHRSRWYTGLSDDPMSADTRGFEGSTYVDAAAFVNITDKLQFTLDAVNLTNQKDTQFWGQARYLYNQTQSGTTYMAGVSYKF